MYVKSIHPQKGEVQMILSEFMNFYFDHDKLRQTVRTILKENNLVYKQIAPSIGYTEHSVQQYMRGASNSRFMAGALCERFNLNLKDFMREDN